MRKGDATDHSEIKSVQYGMFITLKSGSWEFRTIDEVRLVKDKMDKQMKALVKKTTEAL